VKLEQKIYKTESNGVLDEGSFGISTEDQAWVLGILRNQLYSNKQLAPIREYSTNGHDANVEAGTPDKPCKVHLPTMLEPKFRIRDFGLGLSNDAVLNIYNKYGRSTKRESNAFTGQIGIGSKSAFAYTDSFIITSYFENRKYIYKAYLDESQLGKCVLLSSSDTDEPSGIEIEFTVRTTDISSFVKEAQLFYATFTPRPEINTHIPSPLEFSYKGSNWGLVKAVQPFQGYDKYKNLTARMGNICYPIQKEFLTDMTDDIKELANLPLYMEFNIGEIAVAASREALEYTEHTRLAIYGKFKAIKKALSDEYEQILFKDNKNLWGILSNINSKQNASDLDYRFKNYQEILILTALSKKYKELNNFTRIDNLLNRTLSVDLPVSLANNIKFTTGRDISTYVNSWRTGPAQLSFITNSQDPNNTTTKCTNLPWYATVILDDAPDSINRRIYSLYQQHDARSNSTNKYIIVKIGADPNDPEAQERLLASKVLISKLPAGVPILHLKDYLPAVNIKEDGSNTSSYAPVSITPAGPSAYAKAKVVKLHKSQWVPADLTDDGTEYISVIVSNKHPYLLDINKNLVSVHSLITNLQSLDPNICIYGIKNSEWEKINKKFNIKSADIRLKELLDEQLKNLSDNDKEYIWYMTDIKNNDTFTSLFYGIIYSNMKSIYTNVTEKELETWYNEIINKATNKNNLLVTEINKSLAAYKIIETLLEKMNAVSEERKRHLNSLINIAKNSNIKIDSNHILEYSDLLDLINEFQNNIIFKWIFINNSPPKMNIVRNVFVNESLLIESLLKKI